MNHITVEIDAIRRRVKALAMQRKLLEFRRGCAAGPSYRTLQRIRSGDTPLIATLLTLQRELDRFEPGNDVPPRP